MRIPRIYTGQELRGNTRIALEPRPSAHIARALRMREGDKLTLFNGEGGEYLAAIAAIDKKKVVVTTGAHQARELESGLHIHLGIAVSRGDRMDWMVQKATELGVGALTPLFTERTEVKLTGERAAKKIHHWQQIAISACEQCGRNRVPSIDALQDIGDWLASTVAERKFVLHHRADSIGGAGDKPASIALLVGPEGGLSDQEISAAEQAGFQSLRLGPRVLRTETAPLAAIAILQAHWGDMQLPVVLSP
ncbi:MAG: 16S rRNA (uracil(1498)-N(3))-methyltransferase [Gammaproteobacteria bacterium]|nr:MAG: 16S rRNA (uracil(1498)-N(3))-methyltransferase [Gammaproteobacteria bacterium]